MPTLGGYSGFPVRFGGGESACESVHKGLLQEYSPALDVSEDEIAHIEAYAEASVIENGWVATNRLRNQGQPLKMLENLTTWEESTGLQPHSQDRLRTRQQALAAKLRGSSGNTMTDTHDALEALSPVNFVALHTTAEANEITYWPAMNPGPPGLEWASNVAVVHAEFNRVGLTDDQFDRLVAKAAEVLDAQLPSWMGFQVFVQDSSPAGEGFVLGQSQLGVNGL